MEELIIRAKKGDKEAFTQLIIGIKNDLYKILKSKTTNEEDINDIMQETTLNAYRKIKSLKDPSKFKAWMITILVNNYNKLYRNKKKDEILMNNYNIEYHRGAVRYSDDISEVESTLDFYEMIKELSEIERTIIVLYYGENHTTKEISNMLKLNENNVKAKISRARQKIKKAYKGGVKLG